MSNPFEIAAKATTPTPLSVSHLVVPAAARPGPRPKPLAERRTLHSLQLARRDATAVTVTTDSLLAQFKANKDNESDSDSLANNDLRRRSYTREQKLAAIGYAATKKGWNKKEQQMVLISHKEACRDLGIQLIQLRQ
jgi:hypothetical protein